MQTLLSLIKGRSASVSSSATDRKHKRSDHSPSDLRQNDTSSDSTNAHDPSSEALNEKSAEEEAARREKEKAAFLENLHAENIDRRRDVNSLPPWIHSLKRGENADELEAKTPLIPSVRVQVPSRAKTATHHYLSSPENRDTGVGASAAGPSTSTDNANNTEAGAPNPTSANSATAKYSKKLHNLHKSHIESHVPAGRGKQWNHLRSREAVTLGLPGPDYHSRWMSFAHSSMPPRSKYSSEEDGEEGEGEKSEIVSDEWLKSNLPDLDEPWRPATLDDAQKDGKFWLFSPSKRMSSYKSFKRMLMRNPFIPLIIRVIVLTFTVAALALGVKIFQRSEMINNSSPVRNDTATSPETQGDSYICKQQTSTYMAFIIDSVAVIYLGYITYDEYFSKPLGLRRTKDKMRLLFLDLLFIIYSAANLSLAFNTVTDRQWSCFANSPLNQLNEAAARSTCLQDDLLCDWQKGLCSVLLIAEIAWVSTFAISVLRVVERIQG